MLQELLYVFYDHILQYEVFEHTMERNTQTDLRAKKLYTSNWFYLVYQLGSKYQDPRSILQGVSILTIRIFLKSRGCWIKNPQLELSKNSSEIFQNISKIVTFQILLFVFS